MPVISNSQAANSALYYLNEATNHQNVNLAKLASGSRIVEASDDAAGLAIGTQLDAGIAALQQDQANLGQGEALLQTADAGLSQISAVLMRMQSLAAAAISGQVSDSQRVQDLDTEYQQLAQQINVIASATEYGGTSLLSFANTVGGAFSWQSSSVLANFYQAQVVRNTQQGAANNSVTAADLALVSLYGGAGAYGLPTGTSGTFDAAPIEVSTSSPFGPVNFLLGGQSSMSVTIGAVNTIFLGMEQDTVSYSDQPVTSVVGTIANPSAPPATIPYTYTAAQWLALNPTQALPGIVNTTVTRTISNVASQSAAMSAFGTVAAALAKVSQEQAEIGAYESRFHFSSDVLASSLQNDSASVSVLNDADVAAMKTDVSSTDVRINAAVAALTQASSLPRELLKLIQS
ncbi:flagellin [Telmatospirillum sp.]|uniref:flagellin n=1 Tax=Telmatospirillum sp. TaxID=2079197 RepID=UPI002849A128|nr:flagellin [Telmatospirillum sp.]MDR3436376.1 flagellin [Telmatospirillum sp.]